MVLAAVGVGIVAALAGGAFASSVDSSVVDAIAPTGSVTLAPGGSGSITINLSVTGSQVGTATFEVNRNWTLSGGTFTGSNPQQFTVPPRAGGDPATTFQTTGTVTIGSGQADGGPFSLQVAAFAITNSNTTGAKLGAGAASSYSVTVSTPPPSDTAAPTIHVSTHNSVPTSGWFGSSPQQVDVSAYDSSGVTNIQCSVDGGSFANASSQAGAGTSSASPRTGTISVAGDGSHVVVCRATDGASPANTGAAAGSIDSVTVNIDTTNPTVNCTVPDLTTWYGANQSVSCTASDSGSDLANSADASFTLSTNVSAGDETAAAQTGSKTVYDNAGNSTTAGPYTFKIDRKAPQQSSCDSADGAWHANDVTLHCTYTDGGSGPATQSVALATSVSAGTETANAAATAGGAQACDTVGNCADSPSDISGNKIDKKAPGISDDGTSQAPTGNDGTNDWYNHDVTVNFSATDGGSGVACTTPWTTTTSGEGSNVTVSSGPCADNVGNNNPGITSSGYHIDKTKPVVAVTGVSDGATYTLGSVPTASCSTTDDRSGVHTQAALGTSGGPVG